MRSSPNRSPSAKPTTPPTPTVRAAVSRFLISTVIGLVLIGAAGFFALRAVALGEAKRDTSERIKTVGELVEGAGLADGLLEGDPQAVARLDEVIPRSVVRGSVVRVKVWDENGTILYSDEPTLIGKRFPLDGEEREILEEGGNEVELSDLSKPENRLEREPGTQLLEAYTPVATREGEPVLFEIYQRFNYVTDLRDQLLGQLFVPLALALLLIGLIQVPLVRRLVRGLGDAATERERLQEHAVEASRAERLRIASDLSAGAVDALTPVPGRLAVLAESAASGGRAADADELRTLAAAVDDGVRQLRGDLTEIHPPNLDELGLDGALHRLLAPLAEHGVETSLEVQAITGGAPRELLYRVAREAIRNAEHHAHPRRVSVRVERDDDERVARLIVHDDGAGFTPAERDEAEHAGRRGLRIAEDLLREQGGELTLKSVPYEGTTVEATVPFGRDHDQTP